MARRNDSRPSGRRDARGAAAKPGELPMGRLKRG